MIENCSKCQKMAKSPSKINRQICRKTFHLKCCGVSSSDSETINEKGSHRFCRNCLQAIVPFQGLDNKKFNKLFKKTELNRQQLRSQLDFQMIIDPRLSTTYLLIQLNMTLIAGISSLKLLTICQTSCL